MRKFLAILVCKLGRAVGRLVGKGSSLPGKYAHSGWPLRVSWSRYRFVMTNSVGWKYWKLRAA